MPLRSPLPDDPKQNQILAALNAKEYIRLANDLELVCLERGRILYEPGDVPDYVYFPTTSIVSRIFTTENGASAELAMTGDDGLVGVSLILGGETIPYRVDVQRPGNAYRLKAEVMRWELDQGGEFQRLALRYTQALMTQIAQSVVCNRHHSLDQQLCRWLLLSLDRVPGNQLDITQERIANMLGVRREGVTEAARHLQASGLIHYSRGHITVIDRPGLEARACECYAAVASAQHRLQLLAPAVRAKNRARPNPATLRRRAEARWQKTPPAAPDAQHDQQRLLHELQVSQIQLEMQQEELRVAYDEADALRERYADIYDFAPASYFTLDAAGTILDLNLAGAILLGIKRSQRNRYRFTASVSPDDVTTFNHYINDVLGNKGKVRCEIALLPTAQRAEARVRIEAVTDESGQECRMVVIDVSPEKQTEKALSDRDQYQRALLDNFPFNVWLKDEQGRFLAVNAPLARDLGWSSPDALVGKTDFDISSPQLAEGYRAEDRAVLHSGTSTNVEQIIEIRGEQRWCEVYRSAIAIDGQSVGTVGFARDITERRVMQQALEDSERQQRSFIDSLPLSVTIAQDGVLRYINPKAAELIGYTAPECVGQSFLPLIFAADRDRVRAEHDQLMAGEALPRALELRLVSKAGRVIDCHCHFSSVDWDNRVASLIILVDVSEEKRLKAELQRLASTDLLTHLANQPHFMTRIDEELSRLQRDGNHPTALLLIDLEPLRERVVSPPDAVDDAVLRLFSTVLNGELRLADVGGRIGDAQFSVLLPGSDLATASVCAERLREKAAAMSAIVDPRLGFALRIGISALCASDISADQVLERARQARHAPRSGARPRIDV